MAKWTVRVTGDGWWKDRVYYLSRRGGLEREGMFPAFKILNRKFMETLTELYKPRRNSRGVTYAHGYTGNYLRNLHSLVSGEYLKIVEGSPTGGREIRTGGKPGSYDDIVKWAQVKLGATEADGHAIARYLHSQGKVGGGGSPMQQEHPVGEPKFAFPEWIVTQKNRRDIDTASRNATNFIVRYLG